MVQWIHGSFFIFAGWTAFGSTRGSLRIHEQSHHCDLNGDQLHSTLYDAVDCTRFSTNVYAAMPMRVCMIQELWLVLSGCHDLMRLHVLQRRVSCAVSDRSCIVL